MAKSVEQWEVADVMAWLTMNKKKLDSAETLSVYIHQKAINGKTLLEYTKDDAGQFSLVPLKDFTKILAKLKKEDERLQKEEIKRQEKEAKKKKKGSGVETDRDDSGVETESFTEAKRTIICNEGSQPSSANTSGSASFGFVSSSGGSTHNHGNFNKLSSEADYDGVHGRNENSSRVPEATYIAPEDIHQLEMPPRPQPRGEDVLPFPAPNRPVPNRPVPQAVSPAPQPDRVYPTLPDPLPDIYPSTAVEEGISDDIYENFDPETSPDPISERDDEWDIYENAPEPAYNPEDEGDDEQIYMNEPAAESSEEEASEDEDFRNDNLAEISRKLTLAMGDHTAKKLRPAVRPAMIPPSQAQQFRRPAEPPAVQPSAIKPVPPEKRSSVPARGPLAPPKPPAGVVRQPTAPQLQTKPTGTSYHDNAKKSGSAPTWNQHGTNKPTDIIQRDEPGLQRGTGGGMSIKERLAMFDNTSNNEPKKDTETPTHHQRRSVAPLASQKSVKNMADLLGGKIGGPSIGPRGGPNIAPKENIRPAFSGRPTSPPAQGPVPSFVPSSSLPPPPCISTLPTTDPPKGNYEDVTINFKPRTPMPPPPSGFVSPGPTEDYADEDDDGIYALESDEGEEPDDIYNDGEEPPIPGYHPHVKVRKEAEDILRIDPRKTCFLIRDSGTDPSFPHVISLKSNGNFEHTRLGMRHDGTIAIGTAKPGEMTHRSLYELVRYHTTTPLNLRGRNVRLQNPLQYSGK